MPAPWIDDPSPLGPDDIRHALLRVWAAQVRDRKPPHQLAKDDAVKQATALCSLLDLLDGRRRQGRDVRAIEETVRMVLEGLRARGCKPPAA
jgi:hypothetical protein